jgi:peptide/nickel transport system substrate-binding protein
VLAACAPAAAPPASGGAAPATQAQPASKKVLNVALSSFLEGFSIASGSSTGGGRFSYIELHSQALFTSDKTTGRPIPRLLAEQPSIDNGGLKLTDAGGMIATYKLRPNLKWADGAPLTTRDLMFTYKVQRNPTTPVFDSGPMKLMDSASAPDDSTFVVNWSQPYYLADAIGLRAFWPLPAHLLEQDYTTLVEEQKDPTAWFAKPYWTSEYVHVGPYKLVDYVPQVHAVFEAVDDYFLGRPKIDRVVMRQFNDKNTVLANILAGSIDLLSDGVLDPDQALEVQRRGELGKIYFSTGTTRFISFQFDSATPSFRPAVLDKRVRQGLYSAIDRATYAETAAGGIPNTAAFALLPPDNPLYSFVKDGWKDRYPYDVNRASAILADAGWHKGADGLLANAAGDHLKFELRTTVDMERWLPIVGDMWRQAGVDLDLYVVPAPLVGDREFRQAFPGGEITARGSQDSILTRLELSESPTAANRYSGNNRGHWSNEQYEQLVRAYRANLREEGRGQAIKQIQDLLLDEMPFLLMNYDVSNVFARKGVAAYQDDFAGGSESGRIYGTFGRNAHEWDIVD